ncbi:MAG: DUF3592 domain-containing protein [Ruminococcus sp.]|nr:DUF3592 domain-containing protein [Ruminococcus sp.]
MDFDEIFAHILHIGVIAIIIYFFINKSTRKTAFRILKISIAVISVIVGVCALCIYLFGTIGILIGAFICIDIYISWIFLSAIKEQVYITKLHKKGCRTNGTLTKVDYYGRSGHNYISYQADGKDYECINGLNVGKWKVGYDKVPVLYDPESPENSCLEKYDLVSAISHTVTISLLEVVLTGSIIYSIICLI